MGRAFPTLRENSWWVAKSGIVGEENKSGCGSLALPGLLLASFPLPLWALEGVGWPKECADTDATSQVPRAIWNLLYFNLSTPTAWPQ